MRARQPRRFPPPWSVEETAACFIVRDSGAGALDHSPAHDPYEGVVRTRTRPPLVESRFPILADCNRILRESGQSALL